MDTVTHTKPKGNKEVISKLGFLYSIFVKNHIPAYYQETIVNTLDNNRITLPIEPLPIKENNGVVIVPNIPDYLNVALKQGKVGVHCKRVRQYKGYLVHLKAGIDCKTYLSGQLSKRNIKNLYAKQRKLETGHKISYIFHYGDITKEHYDYLFSEFFTMLKRRFLEKKMYNSNLLNWKFYYDLAYPMILEKKASLFVIYDGEKPITMTLNFLMKDIVFSYIQTYNIDYSNYNMGDISMVKHIEWCKENNFSVFDLAMGQTDYKLKWCNQVYNFEHHLFFNPSSSLSRMKYYIISQKIRLRQYLRDKDIIGKKFQMDKFLFKRRVKRLNNFNWKES
ncbi:MULTISPECIES: GNAT family N-acetyltransferase [unclassified Arenibacter]|jgi:hypothetical protein|uniref:GNAT family N-acetyltransferase n=1 Tax=unclassified Arenibacter TaxID=2615047 RepID=UPI000E347439|nr:MULTISPECIES: GNAT family N-acetyltransferase [unclassified Arenibacter]MCM4164765.1 hypothetical protein [Arenibacter sp. A80]RFT55833.1 GNAT family N-acetyltransferase [Arenibacter sp. P308M17]